MIKKTCPWPAVYLGGSFGQKTGKNPLRFGVDADKAADRRIIFHSLENSSLSLFLLHKNEALRHISDEIW